MTKTTTQPTPGPFTVRQSLTGADYWYVETTDAERLALFRYRADAERFAGLIGKPVRIGSEKANT